MSITLPTASEATTDTLAITAAATIAAQNAFIVNVTVLINNAINNQLYFVEPLLVPLVTPDFVTTYFTAQGYTVLYPFVPTGPFQNLVLLPEVIPPGYVSPLSNPSTFEVPRFQISWPTS